MSLYRGQAVRDVEEERAPGLRGADMRQLQEPRLEQPKEKSLLLILWHETGQVGPFRRIECF